MKWDEFAGWLQDKNENEMVKKAGFPKHVVVTNNWGCAFRFSPKGWIAKKSITQGSKQKPEKDKRGYAGQKENDSPQSPPLHFQSKVLFCSPQI